MGVLAVHGCVQYMGEKRYAVDKFNVFFSLCYMIFGYRMMTTIMIHIT